MEHPPYREQLRMPEWLDLKERLCREGLNSCADCGRIFPDAHLDIHHKYYESKRLAWDYPDDCFKLLCRECHDLTTEAIKSFLFTLGYLTGDQIVALGSALQQAIVEHGSAVVSTWLVATLENFADSRLKIDHSEGSE